MELGFLTPLTTRPGPGSVGRSGTSDHPVRPVASFDRTRTAPALRGDRRPLGVPGVTGAPADDAPG
ncbi:hypothetical protein A6A06_18085 [Streptomyces sp. CB02923]|uniref:hypothetical protein n=1 Tax=Streptomyces sp. CB02923 TaxID=1718985 RepID=UPI00093A3661|nr:hypothetical protein [Streptomyces sp. CB02923]OKI00822.1 hypothetical protein A6A06_18085 [Streptomyces sp. CB02923]